jgi:hypothetical protein
VACATDRTRHDLMRTLTGGDGLPPPRSASPSSSSESSQTPISPALRGSLSSKDISPTATATFPSNYPPYGPGSVNLTTPKPSPIVPASLGQRVAALGRLAAGIAATGDHDTADRLAGEAEKHAAEITNPQWRVEVSGQLIKTLAAAGDHSRVVRLKNEAVALATQITTSELQTKKMLVWLAEVLAAVGDPDRAEALIARIGRPSFLGPDFWLSEELARIALGRPGGHRGRGPHHADNLSTPALADTGPPGRNSGHHRGS